MSDLHAAERERFDEWEKRYVPNGPSPRGWLFDAWQARAALAPAVPQWMPVETAPKDGTMFLGWVAAERWTGLDGECSSRAHDTSQVDFCWWRNAPEHPAPEAYNGGHYENASGQVGDGQDITHWMPLPAAPDLAAIRLEAHEHGVKCMAESLRKILDGEPCEASVPPELAGVAKRLAAPSVAPEPVAWRDHVEQRLHSWRQSTMNKSGDRLALDDFMGKESIDDLIDYVCDEYAEPAAHPPSVAPKPPTREALAEIVRLHLTSTYHCTRVWEAWHVGTMTEDDFEPASESDMAEEIADAILAANPPRAPLTEEQARELVKECGLDWHRGHMPLFDGDPTNRYAVLVEAVETAHGIGRGQG